MPARNDEEIGYRLITQSPHSAAATTILQDGPTSWPGPSDRSVFITLLLMLSLYLNSGPIPSRAAAAAAAAAIGQV